MGQKPEILLVSRLPAFCAHWARRQLAGILLAIAALPGVTACQKSESEKSGAIVDAGAYDAYWLWAGVKPQGVLEQAKTVYILDSEYRAASDRQLAILRPDIPRVTDADIWFVLRAETLDWPEDIYTQILSRMAQWEAQSRLVGLQIDFDAATPDLGSYAVFLRDLRRRLPARYQLSITGLLDWSANGARRDLNNLAGIVDEIVLQSYQGRSTIPEYADYFRNIGDLNIPFRIGLVQGGEWRAPKGLEAHHGFKGYVIFLLNPPRPGSSAIQR